MTTIGFIGLGNMGLPMAKDLLGAGYAVTGIDLSGDAVSTASSGGTAVSTAAEAAAAADIVVTMLPAGPRVQAVYGNDVIPNAKAGALFVDCSTIDVESARDVANQARDAGFEMIDAPVSGGTGGAGRTLTFMIGGGDAAVAQARPLFEVMGKTIVCGGSSGSQVAKICNNMILGVSMNAVCEAFVMAERLGLDAQTLYDVTSTSSAQCWAITTYCPVPGPVPTSPANRDYAPGFTAAMMMKDLGLADKAAETAGVDSKLGRAAFERLKNYVETGGGDADFSGIIRMIAVFELRQCRDSRYTVLGRTHV